MSPGDAVVYVSPHEVRRMYRTHLSDQDDMVNASLRLGMLCVVLERCDRTLRILTPGGVAGWLPIGWFKEAT